MKIERTKTEVIIRIPASTNVDDLQDIADLIDYQQLTKNSKAKQKDVDELINSLKKGRWNKAKEALDL
jgi:hypothetical protein